MTPPNNSPQAQEVKAVQAWAVYDKNLKMILETSLIFLERHKYKLIAQDYEWIEVEIRPAQSEGNREKEDGLRGWTIYAEQYHVALRALAKLAMLGGDRSERDCVVQEALDEINKIYKRMEPIQNAMNSQGGSK